MNHPVEADLWWVGDRPTGAEVGAYWTFFHRVPA